MTPESKRRWKQERRAQGYCSTCFARPATTGTKCERCREKHAAYHHERWERDPDYRERLRRNGRSWQSVPENREKQTVYSRDSKRRLFLPRKLEALRRYGDGRCACCGETDYRFLTLDHANKDGAAHRTDLGGTPRLSSTTFIHRLAALGWPAVPGLRVLCANCHMAIDLWGGCPHQEARALIAGTAGDEALEAQR